VQVFVNVSFGSMKKGKDIIIFGFDNPITIRFLNLTPALSHKCFYLFCIIGLPLRLKLSGAMLGVY